MMDWERIRTAWRELEASPGATTPDTPERRWRRVRRRDWLETAVAALLLPLFGLDALRALEADRWMEAVFAMVIVVALIYIPIRLWRARQQIPRPDPGQPVRAFLRAERDAARAQAAMLRAVWRWYSAPIAIGVIGLVGIRRGFDSFWLAYTAIVIGLTIAINWANANAARRIFDKASADIEAQINRLEDHAF